MNLLLISILLISSVGVVLCVPIEDQFLDEIKEALKPLNMDAIQAAVDKVMKNLEKNGRTMISKQESDIEVLVRHETTKLHLAVVN